MIFWLQAISNQERRMAKDAGEQAALAWLAAESAWRLHYEADQREASGLPHGLALAKALRRTAEIYRRRLDYWRLRYLSTCRRLHP